MAALEFKFSSTQKHQLDAVEATCNIFKGAARSEGERAQLSLSECMLPLDDFLVCHANSLNITQGKILDNLHEVQRKAGLPETNDLNDGTLRDFTIEMETGTGKTYVYIRTIYELNRRYGMTKFVIVVPSVAIREGVLKSFQTTKAHFEELYDKTPLDFFIYDSKDMGPVGNFATSSSIQVMVINIDAFNKGFEDDGSDDSGNLFHRPSEKLISGASPKELVSNCNPVLIIDEPQSVDNTTKAKAAIKSLNPLFVLRYSATHKQKLNLIYRLTPVDAFEQGLVKSICVDSIKTQENLNGAYVRLESVKTNPFGAKLTIDVKKNDGTQQRKTVNMKTGDDLFIKSKNNSDYEAGWVVSNISAASGEEFVEFQNGEALTLGEAVGDVAADAIKRAQIKRTILNHFERQAEMIGLNVKVLSLFFIDKVNKYRIYEPEVAPGDYAQMFEEEYVNALGSSAPPLLARRAGLKRATWKELFEALNVPIIEDATQVHEGYFAQDKHGHFKDTKQTAGTKDDASAFELIMKKKVTLLSFPDGKDSGKNVSFIFSHSALKEGWDNPNVFQICTLVETKDTLTKRQKIGRGLRLCVNAEGERVVDPKVNVLTVIANESYDAFATSLQREFEEDDFEFEARKQIRNKVNEVSVEMQDKVFETQEFKELWAKIKQRTRFKVNVDSSELIERCSEAIKNMPKITEAQILSERASLSISNVGVEAQHSSTSVVAESIDVTYDLPDPIHELQDALGLTRKTLKCILENSGRIDDYKRDPQAFLAAASHKIAKVKNEIVAKGIEYEKLPEAQWYEMRDLQIQDFKAYLNQNAWEPTNPEKCLYNYVVYDSEGVEKNFADALDKQDEVLVFAKLPSTFKIETPLGTYNPDWAYVEAHEGDKKLYFVTETKGGTNAEPTLRDTEQLKVDCAKKHFKALNLGPDFDYSVKTTYEYGVAPL